MSTTTTVEARAADQKHGMTFAELAAFVDEARQRGVASGTVVKMAATWRQSLQSLTVQVEVDLDG